MLLKDKIAIVTGGRVGIGKAIALRYAKEGAHVVVAEINEATGQQTAAEVGANTGDDIANIAAFLASEESRNITGQSLNVDGGLVWD